MTDSPQTPAPDEESTGPGAQATETVKPMEAPEPSRRPGSRTWIVLGVVLLAQLLVALLAVLPQLSPRVSGTEIQLRVGPVDPIDPFRGAYVALRYPDLPDSSSIDYRDTDERGLAFVPLTQKGEVWVGGRIQRSEPDGLYLRCDDGDWMLRCGIESWFVGQSEARAIERDMLTSGAIATVKVDRWGNASVVGLEPDDS